MRHAAPLILLALFASNARGGEQIWPGRQNGAGFVAYNVGNPTTAPTPATAVVRLTDINPAGAPCLLQAPGANGLPVCAANPVASIAVTDPVSNTGTSTAPIFGLKFTNVDLTLTGAGALQVGAFTGAIVKAAGVTATTFGLAGALSVLANATNGSLAPAFLGGGSAGQSLMVNGAGTALVWQLTPASSVSGLAAIATTGSANDLIAGTIPTARLPTFTNDVVNAGLAMTIQPNVVTVAKIQQFAGDSLVGVAGGSLANAAAITATADNQVYQRLAGTVQAHALDYSQLTGTPAAVTSVAGAVVGAGPGATTTTFGPQAGSSFFGVAGGSTAVPAPISCATPGTFAGNVAGTLGCTATIPATSAPLAAGAVGFGSAGNLLTGDAANFHWDGTNFRLGLRTAAPEYEADFVDEAGAADRGPAIRTFVSSTAGPSLRLFKYRGSFAARTTVTNADYLGRLGFNAYDGTNSIQVGELVGHVIPGATVATGSVPSELSLLASSGAAISDPYGSNSLIPVRVQSDRVGLGLVATDAISFGFNVGAFSGTTSLSRTAIAGGNISLTGSSSGVAVGISRADAGGLMVVQNSGGQIFMTADGKSLTLGSGLGGPFGYTFKAAAQDQVGFSGGGISPTVTDWGIFRVEIASLSEQFPPDGVPMLGAKPLDSYFWRGATYTFGGGANTNSYGFNEFTIGAPTLNSSGSSAVSMATLALLGAPQVSGITGPVYGFDVQGTTTDTSIHTAGGVKIDGQASTALRVSEFGAGYVKSSGSGQFSVGSTVALADLGLCSSGQVIGMVGGAEGCVTPSSTSLTLTGPVTGSGTGTVATSINLAGGSISNTLPGANIGAASVAYSKIQNETASTLLGNPTGSGAAPSEITLGTGLSFTGSVLNAAGTTYTGLSPIIVNAGTGQISCPTCGTSSGSVTGVFGVSGRTVVTSSSPNPTVDLDLAGPGANTYGGSGVSSVTLDNYGRVLGVGSATYLTSTGTTPGTYNNLTVAATGLIVGNSNTSWMAAGALMKSGGPTAVPVPAVAGTDYQAAIAWPATASELLISTGPSTAPTGNAGLTFASGNLILGNSVKLGGLLGNSMLFTDSSGFVATDSFGFTYDSTTHTLSPWRLAVGSSATMGDLTTFGSVQFSGYAGTGGPLRVDPTGFMQVGASFYASATIDYMVMLVANGPSTPAGSWLTSSTIPGIQIGQIYEYPKQFAANTATLKVVIVHNGWDGTGDEAINITRNGSIIGSTVHVVAGTPGGTVLAVGPVAVSGGATTDTYGVTGQGSGSVTNGREIDMTATLVLQ